MNRLNRAASKEDSIHGLVVFNSLKSMRTGATRSIRLALPSLRELGVHLHPVASRSILHFLHSWLTERHLCYDFVVFNGLASVGSQSRFGYQLGQVTRLVGLSMFIYWHETDWVLNRWHSQNPMSARRSARLANHHTTVHLTASKACSKSIQRLYSSSQPLELYECATVPAPFDRPVQPGSPPTVVNLASIQKRKGTDLFVETAIKVCLEHPTVEFIWLGHGQGFGTWQEDIKNAGLEHRILFPGYVDAAHLILRRASIFFLSSRDDPFPLSVLEAMCLGRTVVTFNVGGAPEALGGYGTLISPFDTNEAAAAILGHLERPPERLVNDQLHQRYLEHYTPDQFARRLNRILRRHVKTSTGS